jgi:hypothetical protein
MSLGGKNMERGRVKGRKFKRKKEERGKKRRKGEVKEKGGSKKVK